MQALTLGIAVVGLVTLACLDPERPRVVGRNSLRHLDNSDIAIRQRPKHRPVPNSVPPIHPPNRAEKHLAIGVAWSWLRGDQPAMPATDRIRRTARFPFGDGRLRLLASRIWQVALRSRSQLAGRCQFTGFHV